MNPKDFPFLGRIENFLTRILLWEPIRRTGLGRSIYSRMYLFGKGLAEKPAVRLLREHLLPGMTIVDMGANIGFYTTLLSELVGSAGAVYAFEPDPFCRAILRDRVRALPIQNVVVEAAALGEAEGQATLYCSKRDRAETRLYPFEGSVPVETETVAVARLDTYCEDRGVERIDAMKIDVEGSEVSALLGMQRIMARSRPDWMLIEFCPDQLRTAGTSPESFWRILADNGYDCYGLEDETGLCGIRDTAAFTQAYSQTWTNIWAVRQRQRRFGNVSPGQVALAPG